MDKCPLSTRHVILAFFMARMRAERHDPEQVPGFQGMADRIGNSPELMRAVQYLSGARNLAMANEDRREYVSQAIEAIPPQLSVTEAHERFDDLGRGIFADEIFSWGRISMFILVAAELGMQELVEGNPARVMNFVQWAILHLNRPEFDQFLKEKGGWENVLGTKKDSCKPPEEEDTNRESDDDDDENRGNKGVMTAAFAGALALGGAVANLFNVINRHSK